jgi:hypothetical protein
MRVSHCRLTRKGNHAPGQEVYLDALLWHMGLMQAREGDWYPAGLSFSDMRGLAGYKIFLSVALLLGEGAFIMIKAASLGKPLPFKMTSDCLAVEF